MTDTTTAFDFNTTITRAPAQLRGGPPPIGYYGDTRVTMWRVIPPIIITFGTVGNILTVIVMIRQKLKRLSSTAMYLMALAVSDTLVLFSGPLRNWIKNISDTDVRYLTDSGCKAQLYITYVSIHLSSWLLVAVTMERVFSVVIPHKVKIFCTPKNAGIVIGVMTGLILAIDMVIPIINGLKSSATRHICTPTTVEYLKFRDDVYEWIDFLIAFLFPFIILLAGNILIIIKLVKSQRKSGGGGKEKSTKSLSILLVTLCVIFFVTMSPVSILQIYFPKRMTEIRAMKDPYAQWDAYQYLLFQHTTVNIIGYTNASINFLLYVFSGPKFRRELGALFCCQESIIDGVFGSRSKTVSCERRGIQSTGVNESKSVPVEASTNV